jgi:hypothetical protein
MMELVGGAPVRDQALVEARQAATQPAAEHAIPYVPDPVEATAYPAAVRTSLVEQVGVEGRDLAGAQIVLRAVAHQ